jgi:hypothetical protein
MDLPFLSIDIQLIKMKWRKVQIQNLRNHLIQQIIRTRYKPVDGYTVIYGGTGTGIQPSTPRSEIFPVSKLWYQHH